MWQKYRDGYWHNRGLSPRGPGYATSTGWSASMGGKTSRWVKKSFPAFTVGTEVWEYHWYEHAGLGGFEIKRKRVGKR